MVMNNKLEAAERDRVIDFVGDAIARDRGDAYEEYMSEYRAYATAAVDALFSPELQYGLSQGDVCVFGRPSSIKAVMRALYSDSIIGDVRTQVRHWREECGKVHAHRLEMLDALKSMMAASEEPDPESKSPRAKMLAAAWSKARAAIAKAEGAP